MFYSADKSSSFDFLVLNSQSYTYDQCTKSICKVFSFVVSRDIELKQLRRKSSQQLMEKERSIEETPTWAVSVVCFILLIVCLIIEGCIHKLTEILEKKRRKSLGKALAKTKTEMMKYGFISLLLTTSQVRVSRICVRESVANSFLPGEDCQELASSSVDYGDDSDLEAEAPATNGTASDLSYCEAKGMVSLISSEALDQLNIFISFLAVFHILYCTLTMGLGIAKMRRWKRWEDETRTLEYQIANDSKRFRHAGETLVGKRHLKYWSNYSPLLWMVCFIRQFYGSVSKEDYFILRNGFIAANISEGSNFNFMKFLSRTYDEDFEKIVRIRSWIWIFNIIFIFLDAHVFHSYYWLPIIPFVVAVVAGTKLQVIITNMCVDSCKERPVIKGTLLVKPSDDYFWLRRPEWLLHLLQLILIQNSFQLAYFAWTWYEFGSPRSCFNREVQNIAIRIVMGVATQLLCGYVTLPLYALVTQMGSGMRRAVFTELVAEGLKNWHKRAKQSLSNNNSVSARPSTSVHSRTSDNNSPRSSIVMIMQNPTNDEDSVPHLDSSSPVLSPLSATATAGSGGVEDSSDHTHHDKEIRTQYSSTTSTSEITTVEEEKYKNKIIATVSSDGEISFGRSSWKNNVGSISRGAEEIISSIAEEDDHDIYLS